MKVRLYKDGGQACVARISAVTHVQGKKKGSCFAQVGKSVAVYPPIGKRDEKPRRG